MPTRVQLPDGNIGEFPDGMSQQQIEGVLQKQFPKPAAASPAQSSGVGRFLSSAGSAIASVPQGIYHAAADAPRNPGEAKLANSVSGALTIKRMFVDPQVAQGKAAMDPSKSIPERVGHGLAAVLPAVGPWAAQTGEQIGKQAGVGDYAGAAGTLAGNAAIYAAPKALGKLREVGPEAKTNKLAFASNADADTIKKTLPNVEKAAAATGKRKTVADYLTNIKKGKSDLNTEYANAIGPYANHPLMPNGVIQRLQSLITPNMAMTAAGKADGAAISRAITEFSKPWTLAQLDAERMSANGRLSPFEKKGTLDQYSALKSSRSVAIDKAIADGVRDTVYPEMDQLAGKPPGYFASLKQQIGSLMQMESQVGEHAKGLRDKTARIKGAPLLSKAQAAEGAGSAATGYHHGVIRTLARALVPENPERTANKRVASALRPKGTQPRALAGAAVAGEQGNNQEKGAEQSKGVAGALGPQRDQFMAAPNPKGLVEKGNLPIWNRPTVQNSDGSHSSEYSTSFEDDSGHEVLVPTVVGGKFLTPDGKKPEEGSAAEKAMFKAAWSHYLKSGENLGKFDNPDDADAYAGVLHNRGNSK